MVFELLNDFLGVQSEICSKIDILKFFILMNILSVNSIFDFFDIFKVTYLKKTSKFFEKSNAEI
jgi:hypothetical protein